MSRERSLSLPRSHSPSLLTASSFPPTSTPSTTLLDNDTITTPQDEDCGRLAAISPLTGSEPNVSDNSDENEVTPPNFQSSSVTSIFDLGDNSTASLDDEHIRNTLASPLYLHERGANADHHSNEESLLPGAQSILTRTGKPVALLSQKRNFSQELGNDRIRILLLNQKE